MLSGLGWMIAAHAAVLLGAHALLRRVRTGETDVDILLFLLLRVLLVSAVSLAALLAGVFRGPVLGTAGLAALAGLLAAGEHRHLPRPRWPSLPPLAWALAAFLALRLAAQVWLFAPAGVDVLSYHLPRTAEWIRHGSLVAGPGTDFRETLSAGFELIEAWWMVFLRHDVLIEAAGAEMLAVAFAATAVLARGVGLAGRDVWLAGLFYVLTPGVYLLAMVSANDPPVAALLLATAALLVRRAHPLLLCVPAGLGLGIKATFAFASPGLLLLAWLLRREPAGPAPPRRLALPAAAAALFCGAFWYVRTTVLHGSPTYPIGATTLVPPPAPWSEILEWLPARIAFFFRQALRDEGFLSSVLHGVCGWGPLAFCGLPALVPALREHAALRRLAAAFGVSLASMFVLSAPPLHFLRFLLFFPLIPALAVLRLAADRPALRAFLAFPAAALVLLTFLPHDYDAAKLRDLASLPWRERAIDPVLRALPAGDVVAYGYGMNAMSYAAVAPDFRRRLVGIRDASTPEELRGLLRAAGARWFSTEGDMEARRLKSVAELAVRAGYLRRIAPQVYERVVP